MNEHTLSDYLTNLPSEFFTFSKHDNQLAQKADYIRSHLLLQYGGLWLDSDCVVLSSLDCLFDKLTEYDFVGYRQQGVPCIWAFASRANAPILQQWCTEQDRILQETGGKDIYYGELGHKALIPFQDHPSAYFDKTDIVCPIDHTCPWKYQYMTTDATVYFHSNQPFIMLNNAIIDQHTKQKTREELLSSPILLSQFFRKALE